MAAITICSDFGAPQNKVWHCFHCFPIYFPWSDGTGCRGLSFLNVELLTFSLSSFTFIKRLFSFSSLSAIRVVSSAYLRLLIFLAEILIPACSFIQSSISHDVLWGYWYFSQKSWFQLVASSSPAFLMMCSAYKLNKQGDNIQPWCTPFPIWNQSVVSCLILTIVYWPTCRFLRRQVRWSGIHISLRIFQFVVIHTVKGFSIVNKAGLDVGNLLSGSSASSKSSLYVWKFSVHVLLMSSLMDFEHNRADMWNESVLW